MFHVVLYQPEIPPNTGNIIRLCANTGAHLHLIHPMGFELDESRLRRAHLDYSDMTNVREYADIAEAFQSGGINRLFALSTRGTMDYDSVAYQPGDGFLFGPETRGLPAEVLDSVPTDQRLRIPLLAGNRSLNLSNAVAVVVYEAWRQQSFKGRS
ncbi:MAG: tRNA (uridine(34)/cytosine(34)/5-carboxymethylaminomethyluridine(34)-2'-O)-methyltransferase TrmL [Gammaproteobacteria bacterium RIFCSPLOWO2_02_FULL_61_13]|nr:MAG: tRNA (uridine(34)/cytosine(34)/5-carboxymethylaminomethyluridine(34)-2'-O)-methyltransferase TrmL [Gammaproteobacteria bacterium RIFCSPLOWO2_02_FULL_61_13]